MTSLLHNNKANKNITRKIIKKMENNENMQLPENAFRELKEGENYEPLMSPQRTYP